MRFFYILFILSILLNSCKTEIEIIPDSKPIIIKTLPVGNVLFNQVALNGEISYINDENVIAYGFIIYDDHSNIETNINLGNKPKVGLVEYRYEPQKVFELAKNYAYSFYIQTDIKTYNSPIVRFRVKDFWVDQTGIIPITLGDTLKLTGNFKQLDSSYEVYKEYGYPNASKLDILYLDDKSLHIKIPENLGFHNASLNLYLKKSTEQSLISIKLLGKIEFHVEDSQYLNDNLSITSYGLERYNDNFLILIGNKTVPFYWGQPINISSLGLKGIEHKLGYYNGVDTIFTGQKIKFKNLSIKDFNLDKLMVHPNEYVYVDMPKYYSFLGHSLFNLPTVYYGKQKSPHVYLAEHNLFRIKSPDLEDGEYDITFDFPVYGLIKFPHKIKVEKLKYKLVNSGPIYINDEIIMKGNFRDNAYYSAYVKDRELYYGLAKDGEFRFKIEITYFGNQDIRVGFVDKYWYPVYADNGVNVDIDGIRIDSFYPKSAYAGDIITVKGKGLKSRFASIFAMVGNIEASVISSSDTEVKFYMPISPRKGKLDIALGYNSFDGIVYAKDYIENL